MGRITYFPKGLFPPFWAMVPLNLSLEVDSRYLLSEEGKYHKSVVHKLYFTPELPGEPRKVLYHTSKSSDSEVLRLDIRSCISDVRNQQTLL